MPALTFRAVMKIRDANPYLLVSAARAQALKPGWRKPLPVLIRVNGFPKAKPWRINMMPTGTGAFYLYLHGEIRKASKTGVGDSVTIAIEFDAKYRNGPMHPMPAWFRVPLSKNAKALRGWGELIPSRQKEILRYLASLKSVEARERNVVRALRVLAGTRERYMARSW